MSVEKSNLIVFYDSVSRTIMGEKLPDQSTDEVLAIKNPLIVDMREVPNNPGQISVQFFPLFFKGFLADTSEAAVLLFKRKNLSAEMQPVVLNVNLMGQYEAIFSAAGGGMVAPGPGGGAPPVRPPPAGPQGSSNLIKLFDD